METKITKKSYSNNGYLAMGDYSSNQGNYHKKFHAPVLGIGLLRIIKELMPVFRVQEYLTSTMCPVCDIEGRGAQRCENFRPVKNPRPYQRGKHPIVICWGLKRCTCGMIYNRNHLGSSNIYAIADGFVNGIGDIGFGRPNYLTFNNNNNNNNNENFDEEAYNEMN